MCHTGAWRWVRVCVMVMASADLSWCGQQASRAFYALLCFAEMSNTCVCVTHFYIFAIILPGFFLFYPFTLPHLWTFNPTPPAPTFPGRGWQIWKQNASKIIERKSVKRGWTELREEGDCMGNIMSQLNEDDRNRQSSNNLFCRTFHRGAISQGIEFRNQRNRRGEKVI